MNFKYYPVLFLFWFILAVASPIDDLEYAISNAALEDLELAIRASDYAQTKSLLIEHKFSDRELNFAIEVAKEIMSRKEKLFYERKIQVVTALWLKTSSLFRLNAIMAGFSVDARGIGIALGIIGLVAGVVSEIMNRRKNKQCPEVIAATFWYLVACGGIEYFCCSWEKNKTEGMQKAYEVARDIWLIVSNQKNKEV